MPKISVIIPIFNVEEYLTQCLDSVINQTLKDIEIICVNDGSTDNSQDIVDCYEKKDDRIRKIVKANGGLSSARNAGLEIATGEYVHFMDSDDLLETNAYENLYNEAKRLSLDILYFEAKSFFENDEIKNNNLDKITLYDRKNNYGVKRGLDLFAELKRNNDYIVSACLQLVKHKLIENIRFKEGIYYEDNLFTFMTICRADRAACISKKYYLRRVRNGSITTSQVTANHCLSKLQCFKDIFLESSKYTYSSEQAIQVNDLIEVLQWHVVSTYNKLDDYNRKIYGKYISLPEYAIWHKYVLANEINLKRKNEELDAIRRNLEYKNNEYNRIQHCISYKIGRVITFIPRKVRAGFKTILKYIRHSSDIKKNIIEHRAKSLLGKPHISIIMPVYNAENNLDRSLGSLLFQTMKNIEIICVNDGSTDSSMEILNRYSESDNRIQVFSQENKGAAEARNFGMGFARGEYIIFLDADDYFYPDLCMKTYMQAKINKADICLFGARRRNVINGNLEEMRWVLKSHLLPTQKTFSPLEIKDNIFQITTACPWTKLYRRSFVRKTGIKYQNLSNSNDVFFNRMLIALSKRITYINEPFVEYSFNDVASTQGRKDKDPTCFIKAFELLKKELEKRGLYNLYKNSFGEMVRAETTFNYNSLKSYTARSKCKEVLSESGIQEWLSNCLI